LIRGGCGRKLSNMAKERFWNVDLIELARGWLSELYTFFLTGLMFIGLSLPVVLSALVLWILLSMGVNVR
jgi:hypothetical protein